MDLPFVSIGYSIVYLAQGLTAFITIEKRVVIICLIVAGMIIII